MKIYCDGAGGKDSKYGFLIEELEVIQIRDEKNLTGNLAEYKAVSLALDYLLKSSVTDRDIMILSDSQLMVNQLNHKWSIKSKHLRKLALEIWHKLEKLKAKGYNITLKWISRRQNKMGKALG